VTILVEPNLAQIAIGYWSEKQYLAGFLLITGITSISLEIYLRKIIPRQYKLIPLMIGLSALIIAIQIWRRLPIIDYLTSGLIIMYWLALTFALVVWIRPIFRQKKQSNQAVTDQSEAITITEIRPNCTGRVLWDGVSWQAICEDSNQIIKPKQKVYILYREGNTLTVIPKNLLNS